MAHGSAHNNEQWKPVDGFVGFYEVSDAGRVRRVCDRWGTAFETPRIMKPRSDKDGYRTVILSRPGAVRQVKIHRLVAAAFLPLDIHRTLVNHKNGVRADNAAENLEWCTHAENMYHARPSFRKPNRRRALSAVDVVLLRTLRQAGCSFTALSKAFGVSISHARDVAVGRRRADIKTPANVYAITPAGVAAIGGGS